MSLLAGLGMEPLAAIRAATATGPETLGAQAPRSGRLAPGFDADVIIVDGDPLADISLLADPARITHVSELGKLLKPQTSDFRLLTVKRCGGPRPSG